jgi:hypothetical protein
MLGLQDDTHRMLWMDNYQPTHTKYIVGNASLLESIKHNNPNIYPGYVMRGEMNDKINFPTLLSKSSIQNKNMRMIFDLKSALGLSAKNVCSDNIIPMKRVDLIDKLLKDQKVRVRVCVCVCFD